MSAVWGITDVGAVRQQNQDAFYADAPGESFALCVVCDGMGGAKAGNVASRLAIDTFVEALRSADTCEETTDGTDALLTRAAQAANSAIYERARVDSDCNGMGTTLVAALLREDCATLINVGDSRCYCVTVESIERITRDHSLVEDLVERGEITEEQARQHPQKNLITRALGAESTVEVDLFHRTMRQGEYLFLCSDGLSNIVTDQEILFEILHGGDPSTCCSRLLQTALERGAPDNVTAVLLQV